jgi:hypothetical protein
LEEFRGIWRNSSISRNSADFGGIPRILEEFHGFWRNSTDFGGIPWILEEFRGIPPEFLMISTEFLKKSSGYPRNS